MTKRTKCVALYCKDKFCWMLFDVESLSWELQSLVNRQTVQTSAFIVCLGEDGQQETSGGDGVCRGGQLDSGAEAEERPPTKGSLPAVWSDRAEGQVRGHPALFSLSLSSSKCCSLVNSCRLSWLNTSAGLISLGCCSSVFRPFIAWQQKQQKTVKRMERNMRM